MAVFQFLLPPSSLLPSSFQHSHFLSPNFKFCYTRSLPSPKFKSKPPKASINGGNFDASSSDLPKRRSSKKSTATLPKRSRKSTQLAKPESDDPKEDGSVQELDLDKASINGGNFDASSSDLPKRRSSKKSTATLPKRSRKSTQLAKPESDDPKEDGSVHELDLEGLDDEFDFAYEDPPLVCCFGTAKKEFLPTVRISDYQMHPDQYSSWKHLQWDPPEFARAPSGPSMNVAIALVRLGGRAAFMGKVGDDDFGQELLLMMNKEKVQTRGVKIDENLKTGRAYVKFKFDEKAKMKVETVKDPAEDSFLSSELNIAVLKEARMFHFNSEVLTSPSMHSALFKALSLSKKFGSLIFFDLNLPLPLWKSRDETRKLIKKAWELSDIIEVTRHEIEFLLDEVYYERKRNYVPQYYAESYEQSKGRTNYSHFTREELSPLWHDGLKFLFVTDATLRLHYYTPTFDGVVIGIEDVLITPFTCDRSGSGDAVVAGIIRKLTSQPEMFENQDVLERQLRFAISAGIISQWTIGAVRSFPTEGAAQNLKEQVYVPTMW